MSTAALAYNEARLLREHFQLIYGSAEATAFVFGSAVTGATLEAWLQTPAHLAAFQQLLSTYVGPAALVANTTALTAVASSSTAMAAVADSSVAMDAVMTSYTAMIAVIESQIALSAVVASPLALRCFTASAALNKVTVPQMTSASLPSGTASASTTATNYDAWKAFDRTSISNSAWLSAMGSTTNQWLQYSFLEPTFIHSVHLSGFVGVGSRSVKDFTVQRSADGASWETVFTGSAPLSAAAELRHFSFAALGKRRHWRIGIANNNGDVNYVGIAEANFVGFDV